MNKKGFTLIELVSVIIILGIVLLIVFPNVLSAITKGENDLKNDNETLAIAGAKQYVVDNANSFKSIEGITYCLSVKTLYDNGYINTVSGLDVKDDVTLITDVIEVKYNGNKFEYKYVAKTACSGQEI